MKVLYAVNSDLGKHGTIGFRTFHVAKEAQKKGALKGIICRGNLQQEIPKKYIKKVFPFYRIFNLGLSFISQFVFNKFPARQIQIWIFDYFCSKKLEKTDILHIYEYAPRTIKKAKKMGIKVVLDAQTMHPKTSCRIMNNPMKSVCNKHTKTANLADMIIAPSEFAAKSYKSEVKNTKVISVPFGVDINKFKPSKSKPQEFTCVFVGLIEPRKGIDYLVQAWKELNLKNANLVICGRINKTMKSRVDKYRKIKNIQFTGSINPIKYYQNAHIFVFPSLVEGSAKVIYEAMASGLPVITTLNAGPPFKNNTAGIIIKAKDKNSIKSAILRFYKNRKEIEAFGKRARNISLDYTWEKYGENIIKSYNKIKKC